MILAISLRGRAPPPSAAMGKKNISDDLKKRILDLRDQGKSYSEIGRECGLAKSTVVLWVKRGRRRCCIVLTDTFPSASGFSFLNSLAEIEGLSLTDRLSRRSVCGEVFLGLPDDFNVAGP